MTTEIRNQPTTHQPGSPGRLPDGDLLLSTAVFGPETPAYMSDAHMEAEFAYLIQCYSTSEPACHG